MTNWPRGGYPAANVPASELKPPPDSMISKSGLPATYTAAEVKVLTEAALRLGRKEAGEEIAQHTERWFPDPHTEDENCEDCQLVHHIAKAARRIGSQPSPDATSEGVQ